MGYLTRDQSLAHAQDLVAASPLPVSGDFENGLVTTRKPLLKPFVWPVKQLLLLLTIGMVSLQSMGQSTALEKKKAYYFQTDSTIAQRVDSTEQWTYYAIYYLKSGGNEWEYRGKYYSKGEIIGLPYSYSLQESLEDSKRNQDMKILTLVNCQ